MPINTNMSLTYNLTKAIYRIYSSVKPKEGEEDLEFSLNERCKIKSGASHTDIWACTWQIEDTESALRDFDKFGLSGPTKYKDTDEAYLRMFGFFAAIYMQKDAVIELNEILTTRHMKQVKSNFRNNDLVQLRNRIASHNVSNVNDNKRTSITTQTSLSMHDFKVSYVSDKSYTVDLSDKLTEFRNLVNNELLALAKIMLSRFDTIDKELKSKLKDEVYYLERWLKGDTIVPKLDEGYVILTSDPNYIRNEEE